ncbi:uncharacterized protein LOC117483109 [Trematomus bernacchii]|uniref:uncharacterized protein LOC117483109 n=1 Tax=Trematomus bernacchii TaxID=40690 RepID=UPI00146C5F65|nr:uncharacterized protein LOC117483109 [Trematomus bernacchii]
MERLLMERFIEEESVLITDPAALLNMTQSCNREHLDEALKDRSTLTLIEKYHAYEEKVLKGHLGKTAALWMSFINHCHLVFMLLHSVKTNNIQLFHKCNGEMANIFFAFDGHNYSRYLTWLEVYLTNLENTHPGAKDLLSKGGFTGLYSQFGAYQRWCQTTSTRAQFYQKTLEMVDLIKDPDCPRAGKHRELEKAEVKKGEEAIQRTIVTIRNFRNPFTISDKDRLYSLASGAPVLMEVEMDVLQAETVDKAAKAEFIKRLQSREPASFFDPIKKKKLKTMEACNKKVTLTSSQGKVIHLGTPDGFFSKTNKAALLHYNLEDTTPKDLPYPKDALFIQDGMALLHVLTNLPPTCGEICLQVLDQMVAKKHFLFSTDSYHPGSIKAQERLRRGSSEKIILAGPATRKPYDFKMFLTNDDNKKQLCQLLLRVWSDQQAASRLERTEMAVLIVEGRAHQLLSSNGKVEVRELPTIYSNQEETDTRVVLYLHHAAALGYKNAVVRTPDTDIFVILLYHAHAIRLTIYLDTGSGKHRQLLNLSELAESLGEDYCATLLGFHVFSGEDCTSAFKGKGKVGPLKKLEKNPKFHRAFSQLGDNWNVKPEVLKQLEQFTCLIYGESRESSVDVVRAKLLRKMVGQDDKLTAKSKVDLARLPPCYDALKPHVQRVNHRVALNKRADESILEKPNPYDEEQGWMRTDGVLRPVWSCGPVLPTSLVDLLDTTEREQEEEEEEEFDSDDSIENDD